LKLNDLNKDKYLSYFESPVKIIVIYEHHRYDTSDYDSLNTPQIKYLENKVKELKPLQKTGRTTVLTEIGLTLTYPKPKILGASSFDILRYEKSDDKTVFVLTPTQAACYFLTLDDESLSKKLLKELVSKHPINIKKIDFQVKTEYSYRTLFRSVRNELLEIQMKTIDRIIARGQSHLGKIF
jgi:hypothetical protein